jgi:hypothetical protein
VLKEKIYIKNEHMDTILKNFFINRSSDLDLDTN